MLTRRLGGALLLLAASAGQAQEPPAGYPARPIRIVIPSVPGGGLDVVTRMAAQALTEKLGQSVVVDNRTGGATIIATDIGAKAPPDGYTLYAATDTVRVLGVTKRVAYDVRKAFDPIAIMATQPYLLLISPTLPVRNVKELVAYSMNQPLSFGSSGVGTIGHIGLETFASITGGKYVHVPYKGDAASLLALLSNEIHFYPGLLLSASGAIKSGKVRLLAALSPKRVPALPDLPTVAEQGYPNFKITNSYTLYATGGSPRPIVAALNRMVYEHMHSPAVAQKLHAEGSAPGERMNADELRTFVAREYDELEKQIKRLNVKLY